MGLGAGALLCFVFQANAISHWILEVGVMLEVLGSPSPASCLLQRPHWAEFTTQQPWGPSPAARSVTVSWSRYETSVNPRIPRLDKPLGENVFPNENEKEQV